MRLFFLQLAIILVCNLSVEYCRAQNEFIFKEEPVVPCGGWNSKQVDVRGSRKLREAAEVVIAAFKQDSFGCKEPGQRTLLTKGDFRIDLQDPQGGFPCDNKIKNGKRCRNLQIQQNIPRKPGFPTTVATVLIQCDKTFPIQKLQDAFVTSMTKCALVRLEGSP